MKFLFASLLALSFFFFAPTLAQANEQELLSHSCRAKAVDKFYCPVHSDWWNGPYYDRGCSVKCEEGQKATCTEASCDDGDAVPSSCSCN